jgi:hypothetical protein
VAKWCVGASCHTSRVPRIGRASSFRRFSRDFGGHVGGTDLARDCPVMDDLPFDFTEYVSQRLGLPEEETKRLLAAWLKSYEPLAGRPTLARTRGAADLEDDARLRRTA